MPLIKGKLIDFCLAEGDGRLKPGKSTVKWPLDGLATEMNKQLLALLLDRISESKLARKQCYLLLLIIF